MRGAHTRAFVDNVEVTREDAKQYPQDRVSFKAMNTKEICSWWQLNSFFIEVRVRRLNRAQRWAANPKWHIQELAAHFGYFAHVQMRESIFVQGHPTTYAPKMVHCLFSDFRHAAETVDGFGDFWNDIREREWYFIFSTHQDWVEERERFMHYDFSEMRRPELTHTIPPPASLRENVIPYAQVDPIPPTPIFEEEPEIFVCDFMRGEKVCGCKFNSRRALYAHARFSHNLRHVLSSLIRTNQCILCLSKFRSVASARSHAIRAVATGVCHCDLEYFNTKLVEITDFQCHFCDLFAKDHWSLQRHFVCHARAKPKFLEIRDGSQGVEDAAAGGGGRGREVPGPQEAQAERQGRRQEQGRPDGRRLRRAGRRGFSSTEKRRPRRPLAQRLAGHL